MKYERYDGCCGEVTSRCKTGVFLKLDNGESGFAHNMRNLPIGAKIIGQILRPADSERRAQVFIESSMECFA